MNDTKYTYETPETQVIEVKTEGTVLMGSSTDANRESYGDRIPLEW